MSKLKDALRSQAQSCAALGSPFMDRLLVLLAERLNNTGPIERRLFEWPGDISPASASVPLRLAGALHAQALSAPNSALANAYPPHDVSDDVLWQAVHGVFETKQFEIMQWLDSPPQTNEVRRSAVLIAAASFIAERLGPNLILSELGASAGLNLMFDRFALSVEDQITGAADAALTLAPDWTGPPPGHHLFEVVARGGVDLNPLDPTSPADQMRLRAYLWADQPHRRLLTDAAIECFDALVDAGSAESWLSSRLQAVPKTGTHLIYHTVAWQYFPADIQADCKAQIEAAGALASSTAPLAWLGMETDADPSKKGAALTLRIWPGDLRFDLGRADFHGRWVEWSPTEISQ